MTLITQNNLGKSLKEREEYISRITSTTPDGKNHDHIHLHFGTKNKHSRHTHASTGLGILHGPAGPSHLLAVAPNANSSIIAGTSPSIEPWKSNAYTHRTRVGSHLVKNPNLAVVLEEYSKDIKENKRSLWISEQWKSIILNEGSVQHLEFMSEWHKKVFKTAFELDQRWVVDHAGDRQKFICQGQSVNLFFPAGTDKAIVNSVHIRAWKNKLKGLYYLRTNAGASAEKVSEKVEQNRLQDFEDDDCLSCQG